MSKNSKPTTAKIVLTLSRHSDNCIQLTGDYFCCETDEVLDQYSRTLNKLIREAVQALDDAAPKTPSDLYEISGNIH